MSYNYLFRKAGRLIKSYINSLGSNEEFDSVKKKKIFDDYIREETRKRAYNEQHSSYSRQNTYGGQNRGTYQKSEQQKQPSPRDTKSESYYYNVLSLKPQATVDEIKKAYKILMNQYHPDKVATLGIELQNLAKKKTQEINEAYAFIKKKRGF